MSLRYNEPAAGPPVATERIAGEDFQLIKLVDSTSGSVTPIGTVANPMRVKDDFAGGEVLAEQSGAAAVLTFTFASAVQLVVVESAGADLVSRADPYGGTPSASLGIPCRDQTPMHFPVTATTVKVYAPTGTTVNVWGMRR